MNTCIPHIGLQSFCLLGGEKVVYQEDDMSILKTGVKGHVVTLIIKGCAFH